MAKNVQTRFKQFLPGNGIDASGNPKQGKTRKVGVINVTSYSGGEGEPLKAIDLGLTNIDSITLRNQEEASGAVDASGGVGHMRGVIYAKASGHFYLFNIAGATGVPTGVAKGTTTNVIEFDVFGDAAEDVELL